MPKVTTHPRLRVHVRKSKSGKVRAYYFYDMRPDGKADIPLGTDHAQALAQWRELHHDRPRAVGLLQEAMDRFRRDVLPAYANADTRASYSRQLANVQAVFGEMAWADVSLPLLREYLDRRTSRRHIPTGTKAPARAPLAKTQGNREMSVLSIVWGRALLWGMTRCPWPAQGIKDWKHHENARMFDVTDALFEAIYAAAEPMLRDALDIATATGMRLTDVRTVSMPVADLLRLKASKTGKLADFDLAMSQVLPGLIERRRALGAHHVMLLSMPDGTPVTLHKLRGAYDRARHRAAAAHPDLASQIRAMYLRDMRKRASDLPDDIEDATRLLQHSSQAVTERHYRTRVVRLKPAR